MLVVVKINGVCVKVYLYVKDALICLKGRVKKIENMNVTRDFVRVLNA